MPSNTIPDLTTDAFGAAIGVKGTSVRVRLCRTGSYFGIKPKKYPNGRLMWPGDAPDRLAANRPASSSSKDRG